MDSSGSRNSLELGANSVHPTRVGPGPRGAHPPSFSVSSWRLPNLPNGPPSPGITRANFARAGCRPPPLPAASSVADSAINSRVDEGFNRAVSLGGSDTSGPAPPGLGTPQRSAQFSESEGGWRTRTKGQNRRGAASTVVSRLEGRELTREPQVLAYALELLCCR
jgi:hypothetical protein